jgi:hypothetical protein
MADSKVFWTHEQYFSTMFPLPFSSHHISIWFILQHIFIPMIIENSWVGRHHTQEEHDDHKTSEGLDGIGAKGKKSVLAKLFGEELELTETWFEKMYMLCDLAFLWGFTGGASYKT